MRITRDDVRHLASLSRLHFSEAEEQSMVGDLSRILDYVDQLQAVDTDGVEPTIHGAPVRSVVRPDVAMARITRAEALRSSSGASDAFVRVPKVIDG